MLDTHGRRFIDPFIKKGARLFINLGLTPNAVTLIAFIIGVSSGALLYLDMKFIAVGVLWLSGYLDAVDGEMARTLKQTSPFGTLLDITFDRLVEISIIVSLAVMYPSKSIIMVILSCSIILSMTIFLTVGALSNKSHMKSFYYQAGVAERTEGFILFTLMMIFQNYLVQLTLLFSILVIITAGQRFFEAKKILT